jgi:hypothetical protein
MSVLESALMPLIYRISPKCCIYAKKSGDPKLSLSRGTTEKCRIKPEITER